jgi:4-amino-4-deoxy-L-arabinose transferase-like glycosyltransferase
MEVHELIWTTRSTTGNLELDQQRSAASPPRISTLPWLAPVLLGLIIALALGLRLWGLNWSLPWPIHPDERTPVDQARAMLASGDLGPEDFKNPSAFIYLIAGELLVTQTLGTFAGPFGWDVPGSTHLLARLTSALVGTASVGVLYAVGASLFGRPAGLLAALFLAVSFIHVRNSHYGVNDVTAVGLLLVSLYFAVRLLRRPALRWYVLAGLVGGLATSTKYSMGFFFAPILVAHWLASRGSAQELRGRSGIAAVVLAGASGLAGYLIGTPYTVLNFGGFWSDFVRQHAFGGGRWLGQPPDPVPWLYLTSLLQGFGVVPLAFAVLGLVAAGRSLSSEHQRFRWPAEALVLLAFPLMYLAFLLPKAVFFPRLILPLVPFCSLLAGYGVIEAVRWCGLRRRSVVLATLVGVALVQPLIDDVRHNRLLLQTNTRVLATAWALANLPPGSSVKAELRSIMEESTEGVPYPRGGPVLDIDHFDGRPEFDEADDYADQKVQYFVTSSHAFERLLGNPPLRSQRASGLRYLHLHRSLAKHAQLLATFSPGHGGREVPYSQDEIFTPFWNLDQYDRPGPTIRIYSLNPQLAERDADR